MSQLIARPVQGTLQDGSIITIQGSVPPNSNGFSINLAMGGGEIGSSDIALHVNPRFNENATPRNSYQNGGWGQEDRSGTGGVPVTKGAPFECIILVQQDKYMVSFNGRHFCEFKHRLPKERVTNIVLKGDVQVTNVMTAPSGGGAFGQPAASTYGGGYGQPQPGQPGQPGGFGGQPGGFGGQPGGFGQPAGGYGQPTPQPGGFGGQAQRQMIPGGMRPGRIVYINGNTNPGATSFQVNLKSQEQGGDIHFHLNPRFNERTAIKNSMLNGSWGPEERATGPFPFTAGSPFQMMILADQSGEFKVAVNSAHYTEFRQRNPNLQAIQWVEVTGDVTGVTINAP